MPRQKRPTFEYMPSRKEYRKRIKDTDGKYVAIYAKTPEELAVKVAAAQRQIENATFRRDTPTVQDYAEKWLSLQRPHIRPTTFSDYSSKVKNYIVKPLGEKYMAEITPDDVRGAAGIAATRSASVYRSVQMLYKLIFRSALENHLIDEDPTVGLNPKGGKAPKEKKALTEQQIRVLLDAVRGLPPYPFIMLCLYAGLRREEALALKWDCVDLRSSAPHIDVRRTWHVEHNRPVVTDQLKTSASRRTVPLPSQLVACLKDLQERSGSEYVIANRDGQPLSGSQWARLWNYVTTRSTQERTYTRYVNGQKIIHTVTPEQGATAAHNKNVVYSIDFHVTPHQLRHTYITNLLLSGVDVKTVQVLAGHEHAKITLEIYAHLTYNQPEDLIHKVENALSKMPQ